MRARLIDKRDVQPRKSWAFVIAHDSHAKPAIATMPSELEEVRSQVLETLGFIVS